MIECPFCKKSFPSRRGLAIHFRIHQFSSALDKERCLVSTVFGGDVVDRVVADYVNNKYCIDGLPINIVKYITLLGVKRTSKEERSLPRYKNLYKSSILKKYGVDNVSKSDEIKQKKKSTVITNYGNYAAYLEDNRLRMKSGYQSFLLSDRKDIWQQAIRKAVYDKYGVNNVSKDPNIGAKISRAQKARLSKLTPDQKREMTVHARKANNSVSKLEKRVQYILTELGITFLTSVRKWNYIWDLYVPDKNLLIEVNGDFWHANPQKYKSTDVLRFPGQLVPAFSLWEKDSRKVKAAVLNNYRVITLWERDIVGKTDEDLLSWINSQL